MEKWKQINDAPNYLISNLGNIKNNKTGRSRKKMLTIWRYHSVYLSVNNKKQKWFPVHRLVANAFIPEIAGKKYVNHKDNDRLNNNVNNLEWCTQKENMQHASKNGRLKGNGLTTKLTSNDIVYIRTNPDNKKQKELAEMFNLCQSYISLILKKKKIFKHEQ